MLPRNGICHSDPYEYAEAFYRTGRRFSPTLDPFATHFGLKPVGLPDEAWPESGGKPLVFVCQLNLTTAPVVPERFADIRLITFFVEPETAVLKENGGNWCLRAYKSLDELVPLSPRPGAPKIRKGFECTWQESPANAERTKIGGRGNYIQSEPWWDYRDHPSAPAYCLQINSEEKVGLGWGDSGTLYIARGTTTGCEDQWFLDIQFF
jgi:hypothetical protein